MRSLIRSRPNYIEDGDVACYVSEPFLRRRPEFQLTLWLMTHRYLFGLVYGGLMADFFHRMPLVSGVFVAPTIPTHYLSKDFTKPGDIDLLVIPYEGDEILLNKVLAVEVKAVQASFVNQGKSPGGMGFTQANGLVQIGFPYVAVAHLIVSDESPEEAWKPMGAFRVINEEGLLEALPEQNVDHMPAHLMERALGRMRAHSTNPQIGCAAVYMGRRNVVIEGKVFDSSTWHPYVDTASENLTTTPELLARVGEFFDQNARMFMDIPRYPRPLAR